MSTDPAYAFFSPPFFRLTEEIVSEIRTSSEAVFKVVRLQELATALESVLVLMRAVRDALIICRGGNVDVINAGQVSINFDHGDLRLVQRCCYKDTRALNRLREPSRLLQYVENCVALDGNKKVHINTFTAITTESVFRSFTSRAVYIILNSQPGCLLGEGNMVDCYFLQEDALEEAFGCIKADASTNNSMTVAEYNRISTKIDAQNLQKLEFYIKTGCDPRSDPLQLGVHRTVKTNVGVTCGGNDQLNKRSFTNRAKNSLTNMSAATLAVVGSLHPLPFDLVLNAATSQSSASSSSSSSNWANTK